MVHVILNLNKSAMFGKLFTGNKFEFRKSRMRNENKSLLAAWLGILSFIGMLIWTAVNTAMLLLPNMMMGDGSDSGVPKSAFYRNYSGSIYLLMICLMCLPFMRGGLFITTSIVAHIIFAIFAYNLVMSGGVVFLILFVPFIVGWFALCYARLTKTS